MPIKYERTRLKQCYYIKIGLRTSCKYTYTLQKSTHNKPLHTTNLQIETCVSIFKAQMSNWGASSIAAWSIGQHTVLLQNNSLFTKVLLKATKLALCWNGLSVQHKMGSTVLWRGSRVMLAYLHGTWCHKMILLLFFYRDDSFIKFFLN